MTKISKLTPEQEAMIPVYIEKWLSLAERPVNYDVAETSVIELYKRMGYNNPPKIVWSLSPDAAIKKAIEVEKTFSPKKSHQQISEEVNKNWYLTIWWNSWAGYYDFAQFIGVEFDQSSYKLFQDFITEVSFIIPYEEMVFISEKPKVINWKNKKLHCDGDAAVKYSDGYSIYALNGVKVSKEIAVTPAEQLNTRLILEEKNAEIRREIVRKIGIERVLAKLNAKVIDKNDKLKGGPYELLQISIPGMDEPIVALKMINPSIGTYHVEYVISNIMTCEDALKWRTNGGDWNQVEIVT